MYMWHSHCMSNLRRELHNLHASVCKGLADPKRLMIINALRDGEKAVSDICAELGLAQSNVSQHLSILRDKGLVRTRREGQFVLYSLTSPKIIQAMDLLREVMAEQVRSVATVD
jgi:ArsR family transcriptional regulator, virulence genes transcriptional regulator